MTWWELLRRRVDKMSSSAMAGTGTGGGLVGMLGGRVAGEEKVNKKPTDGQ